MTAPACLGAFMVPRAQYSRSYNANL